MQENAAIRRVMALHLGGVELGAALRQATSEIVSWSSRQTMVAIGGAMATTLNLVIALFGAYYLLTAGDAIWTRAVAHLPVPAATAEALRVRFHRVTEAMVLGVVFSALAQGTLVGLAFWALGFPHVVLWGAVTAVASVLPIFGSGVVWLPAAAVLLAQHRYGAAIALLAYGAFLVSNVDNLLRLLVYRRVSQIHPMVTLVGAFAGVKAFGMTGLLLGPLVLSYAMELATMHADVGESPIGTPGVADTKARGVALT
jgi:predicted PurR-regulated permease PerM